MKQRTYVRHGLYKHPLYATWQNMKRRCYDTNNTKYHRYGGRGIKVCDAWLNDFAQFIKDMGDKPSPRHTVDRIDNDGDYTPDNCRWAPYEVQNHNQSISKNNTSGVMGVSRDKTGLKWRAYICINRQIKSLGYYVNKADAIAARRQAESELVYG